MRGLSVLSLLAAVLTAPLTGAAETLATIATLEVGWAGSGGDLRIACTATGTVSRENDTLTVPATPLPDGCAVLGYVDAPFHRMPYYDATALSSAVIAAGTVVLPSSAQGLDVASASLSISVDENSFALESPTEQGERLVFEPAALGAGGPTQTGRLEDAVAPVGAAQLAATAWVLDDAQLAQDGTGFARLTSQLQITSPVQANATLPGDAELTLVFMPEPDPTSLLIGGIGGLAALARRRRRADRAGITAE
jgi:hypothetical protein